MFSFNFFNNTEPTRLASCQEVRPLLPILNKLRKQVTLLEIDAQKEGLASLAAEKHTILSELLAEMDKLIDQFNGFKKIKADEEQPLLNDEPLNDEDDLYVYEAKTEENEMLALVQNLKELVSDLNLNYGAMRKLNTKRNDRRENVNENIHIATTSAALILACGMPLTFPVGVVATYGTYRGNEIVRDLTGLSDLTPRSARIVRSLVETLDSIEEQIYTAQPLVTLVT